MTKIYYELIMAGRITIDDVPTYWRTSVEKIIKENT